MEASDLGNQLSQTQKSLSEAEALIRKLQNEVNEGLDKITNLQKENDSLKT